MKDYDENPIFPQKPDNSTLTDDQWIRECILVWCCNSLNEREGTNRELAYVGGFYPNDCVSVTKKSMLLNADLFERAQNVIHHLLHEYDELLKDYMDASGDYWR